MTTPTQVELVQAFRFKVTLTLSPNSSGSSSGPAELGDGLFAECSGLELEADVRELLEGGRNDGVIRRVGRVKLMPLVLKRGMFLASPGGYADTAIWDWLTGMVTGTLPIPRYDGLVQVLAPNGSRDVARWTFLRALPSKVSGPALNAKTGEIAIEELHLVHEGLRLEGP
ncbi:MAG TPA: phage tail protein [Jatrophihabitans sp.]|jgi:phage tail-like protein|nr:phage tail protein [Jatrophihabitans sp.]